MRTSPRRPLILKRRKLSLPVEDAAASQRAVTKNETDGRCDSVPIEQHAIDANSDPQKFPAGIKIVNHPSMPNTQVVFIPKHANVQNIIAALTAKGKECGSTGPNKFILISGGGTLRQACPPGAQEQADKETSIGGGGFGKAVGDGDMCISRNHVDVKVGDGMLLHTAPNIKPNHKPKPEEENSTPALTSCPLDESLTNIQWLGKMSSDGLGSCTMRQELEDKENQPPVPQSLKQVEEDVCSLPCGSSFTSWQESISERPPYSYMAMIQFAINSTDRKRMTLKEIYTWIEDHFPYFKHVAKPGWKNSIRHNLSLHDMFVRETSANGKISFWTIHPDANRCLTLDQVFKPMDQSPLMQVLPYDPQQKRLLPELQKCVPAGSGVKSESLGTSSSTERKMKLLLPRVNSYFVPVHFPLSQQFIQQPSGKMPLSPSPPSSASTADLTKSKHVQIVPKPILQGGSTSTYLPLESTKETAVVVSEEAPSAVIKDEEEDASLLSSLKENTSYTSLKPPAWRKHDVQMSTLESSQSLPYVSVKEENHLTWKRDCQFTVLRDDVPLSSWKEERALTAAKSPARKLSDMQVIRRRKSSSRRKQHLIIPCAEEPLLVFPDCNNSDSGLVSDFSFLQETQAPEHPTDLSSAQDTCPFKTPIKEKLIKLPVSSTPSKPIGITPQASGSEPWRVTSLNKEGGLPDFSPVRLPPGTTLTPFKDSLDLLGFSSPPFHDVPLFESPQQLLNSKSPDMTSAPFTSSPTLEPHSAKRCSKELPIGNLTNRSLTEGLVLDTMNDSLSKILLDISFTGLDEDDRFDGDNVSWSQLIPELR